MPSRLGRTAGIGVTIRRDSDHPAVDGPTLDAGEAVANHPVWFLGPRHGEQDAEPKAAFP